MDTEFQFAIEPCYNAGQLKLRRLNAAPDPVNAFAPREMQAWLVQRGWNLQGDIYMHPNTGDCYTWEQAMAIEFFRFVNIGMEG